MEVREHLFDMHFLPSLVDGPGGSLTRESAFLGYRLLPANLMEKEQQHNHSKMNVAQERGVGERKCQTGNSNLAGKGKWLPQILSSLLAVPSADAGQTALCLSVSCTIRVPQGLRVYAALPGVLLDKRS